MNKYIQVISYLFWGAVTTGVNWIVYVTCVNFFSISPFIGNIISWVAAVVIAFITNKLYVFKERTKNNLFRELLLFVSARIFSGVLEIVGLPVLMLLNLDCGIVKTEGFTEKILLSIIVVVMNYFFSKFYIFKNRERKNSMEE